MRANCLQKYYFFFKYANIKQKSRDFDVSYMVLLRHAP